MAYKNVGGQAVIEGVMMRNKDSIAIAVRKPDNSISVKNDKIRVFPKWKWLRWPFIRGMISLIEMMIIGIKALNHSANESLDEPEEKKDKDKEKKESNIEKKSKEKKQELSPLQVILTMGIAFAMAIFIFKFMPLLATQGIQTFVPYLKQNGFVFNLIEGLIKTLFFVAYIWGIGLMPDVKRIFQYHGAEHKSVHCYEADEELTVNNVRKYPPEHARCGTSFIIFVLFISILVYTFIPNYLNFWLKFLYRILLLPVIAGISYEILKLNSKFSDNKLLLFIDKPGLWIQKLTTKEPDEKQIEVAIKALKAVI